MQLVYYSGKTERTHRFAQNLDVPTFRIPERGQCAEILSPYVLLTPTYADVSGRHAVPKQVVEFLKMQQSYANLTGVIASGDKSFGNMFALAGRLIANKFRIPLLHAFELSGMPSDHAIVQAKIGAIS